MRLPPGLSDKTGLSVSRTDLRTRNSPSQRFGDREVTWGILGTADVARRRFVPGARLARNAVVLAVASREEAKARAFAGELGIERAYGSYEALLADPDIEAVYIPLPNDMHAEWTKRAAAAGKHVLCEKPIAVDAAECGEMVEACRKAGVFLMEGFMYRFHPRTRKIKELISGGALGEPLVMHITSGHRRADPNDIRFASGKGGGALIDVGCYGVSMARYLFDAEPVAVYGNARLHQKSGCDVTFSGLLEFPEGRVALFDCSFETSYKQMLQVSGTTGTLIAEKPFVPGSVSKRITIIRQDAPPERIRVRGADQFALEITHFSDCVRTGRPPILGPEDAIGNLRVIDALRESVASGVRVKLGK